jgi:hypothetical protein
MHGSALTDQDVRDCDQTPLMRRVVEMYPVSPTCRLPAYRSGARSLLSATGRQCPTGLHQVWIVLLVSVFLVATTMPHFGTLWHTHDGGYISHQHPNLTALSGSRRRPAPSPHHHHHGDHQTPQALPFGGYYAHSASQPDHHGRGEDASTPFHYETWTRADLHWHLYDASLPSLSLVILWFGLCLYAWFLITYGPLLCQPKLLYGRQPRAPPVQLKSLG